MEVRDEMEVLERDEPLKAHRLKMKIIDTKCWDKLQVVESFQQSERGSQREEGFNEFVDKPTWISRISSCPGQDLDSAKACWKNRVDHTGRQFERVTEGGIRCLKVPIPTRAGLITARKKITKANKKIKHCGVAVAKAMLRRTAGSGHRRQKQDGTLAQPTEDMSDAEAPSDAGGGVGFANETYYFYKTKLDNVH